MKKFCMAVVLALTFTVSVSAGHIECGITDPPPPPPTGEVADGHIECGITASVQTLIDSLLSVF